MARFGVYGGVNKAHCLRASIDTKYGEVCTDLYVGIIKPEREGVSASDLTAADLELGNFHKSYNPDTQSYGFQVGLRNPGKFGLMIVPGELNVDGGRLFFNSKLEGTGRDGKYLNVPCDGEPYVKLSEVLGALVLARFTRSLPKRKLWSQASARRPCWSSSTKIWASSSTARS